MQTVEEEVRASLAQRLGGLRGSIEMAVPLVMFTLVYLVTRETLVAVLVALGTAVATYGLRLLQRSETTFVRQGLLGILIAVAFVVVTGEPEGAFLPYLLQSSIWAVALAVSLVVRWPLAGFVIGAVLNDTTGWRGNPALLRVADRLTLVLLAPMIVRLGVQVPLYLAEELSWLAVSRVVLDWPLHAVTLAAVGLVLLRGRTPLPEGDQTTSD